VGIVGLRRPVRVANPNPSPDDRGSMSITTKNPIASELADTLTDPDHEMWDNLYDWYDEVRDLDISKHYTLAELRAVGVKYADEDIIVALNDIRNAVERDIREAEKQDRWETRYWHERDYGGRL